MFLRIVAKSVKNRKMRIAVAVFAVLLGGSLVSALTNLSLDVGSKVGRELRAYGANIVVTPRVSAAQTGMGNMEFGAIAQEKYLAEKDVAAIKAGDDAGEVIAYAPYLYGIVEVAGKKAVLAGVDFRAVRSISPWWQVTGDWVSERDRPIGGMVGVNLARDLKLSPGDTIVVRYGTATGNLRVSGVVDTGGAEENQIFAPLEVVEELLGKRDQLSLVQVSALSSKRPLAEVAKAIEGRVPGSQAKVIGQIAEAEAGILAKIQLLMALVAILVLLASGLAVGSTMTASVLERTREIGLMKALGAGDRRIAGLFMAEMASIAAIGGLLGYLLGLGLAQVIGQSVFGSAIYPNFWAALATLLVALAVCLVASAMPMRRALAIDPAVTLRGE